MLLREANPQGLAPSDPFSIQAFSILPSSCHLPRGKSFSWLHPCRASLPTLSSPCCSRCPVCGLCQERGAFSLAGKESGEMDTEIKTHLECAVLGSFCLPPACCSKRGGRKKKKKDFHLSRKKGKKLKARGCLVLRWAQPVCSKLCCCCGQNPMKEKRLSHPQRRLQSSLSLAAEPSQLDSVAGSTAAGATELFKGTLIWFSLCCFPALCLLSIDIFIVRSNYSCQKRDEL